MRTWTDIETVYLRYLSHPINSLLADSMLDLIGRIRRDPEMAMMQRSVALDGQDGVARLLVAVPRALCSVHVDCVEPGQFAIYLDRQGDTPDTYYGPPALVNDHDVLGTLRDHLRCTLSLV